MNRRHLFAAGSLATVATAFGRNDGSGNSEKKGWAGGNA